MSYSSEVLADSPLAYWRLGESSGSTAADASGNGHAGTYQNAGAITLGTTGLLTGDSDTAATFADTTFAASGYVEVAHASWMDVSSLTLECWVKENVSATTIALWDRDPGSGQRPFQFRINSSGKVEFIRISNAAGSVSVVTATSTTSVNNNARHHIAGTYDGTTLKIYVDGSLDGSATASGGITTTATNSLKFGRSDGGGNAYIGVADEVAYYGTALSSTRIAAHYAAGTATGTAATGSGSLSLSGSGGATAPVGGSGALSLSGSGAAAAPAAGSGALTFSASGSTGASTATSGSGSLTLSGSATAGAAASGSASLTLSASGSAIMSSAGTASLSLSGAGSAIATFTTDTSNSLDGLDLLLSATVTYATPVATAPASLVPAAKFDKAIAYPVPTMVNGRPT